MNRNGNIGNCLHENDPRNIFFGLGDTRTGESTPGNGWDNNRLLNTKNRAICQETPKYQQFAIKSVRMSSYRNFPSYVHQSKESLAEAGFFYSGKEDVVYCFFCGQGLKSWEPCDDPWVEHATWSPKCVYVRNVKGQDFINLIQCSKSNKLPTENTNDNISISTEVQNSGNTSTSNVTPTKLLMDTIAAESLIKCGYEREVIRRAIKVYLQRHGETTFRAADIVSIIFEFEDEDIHSKDEDEDPTFVLNSNTSATVNKTKYISDKNLGANILPHALSEENEQLKDQTCCKICVEKEVSIVFLPCGHLCSCVECAPALKQCPICRATIKGTVKAYLS